MENWLVIDNFVLGNTSKFGYQTSTTNDIQFSLSTFLKDPQIVVVLYDKKSGTCYTKTGYDMTSQGDYANNNDYTCYIVKSRLVGGDGKGTPVVHLRPSVVPLVPSVPSVPSVNGNNFVSWDGWQFKCNGNKFVPVGVNCFGLGLCQEYMNYFSHQQITEIFESTKKLSGTCVRSHTLGFSCSSENSLLDWSLNFREKAWDPIDFSLSESRRTGVKVIPILCDPYEYYHGSLGVFCTDGVPKDQFFTHPTARNNFKRFVLGWLNHVNKYTGIVNKDCPDIFAIELGNELGQHRPGAGSTAIPTEDWLRDIADYVKSIAPNLLILCPTDETLGQSNEFNIRNLDIYSHHFYWNDFNRMSYGFNSSKNVGKPYIIGEYSSQFGWDWFNHIENLGVHGSFSWSLYPHENDGRRLLHNDGFDFWFDNQTQENTRQLMLMANHFRKLQGLGSIGSLF